MVIVVIAVHMHCPAALRACMVRSSVLRNGLIFTRVHSSSSLNRQLNDRCEHDQRAQVLGRGAGR